jgi:D-alanine-D-alanine ligase
MDRQAFLKIMNEMILEAPDYIFNALHGGIGEDGHLQALMDLFKIKYNGSDAFASALAMNKALAKRQFETAGIRTPAYYLFPAQTHCDEAAKIIKSKLLYPIVIKPNEEGSTVGLSIVNKPEELETAWNNALPFGPILVEQYIEGRELTVAVLGDRALPVIEIIPEGGFYDYIRKYQKGKTEYVCPADLLKSAGEKVQLFALKAFEVLGCSGYARVDFRMGLDNQFYCLEVNTLPGMTETSLVPKAAKAVGIEFNELIKTIIELS